MTTHLNPLDILLESQQPDRPPPDFRWGVVHGTSPDLSVRLDRDPTAVIGSCCSLSYPLQAGDRVMVMIYDGRAVIFGRGAGDRGSPINDWRFEHPAAVTSGWKTIAYWPGNGRNMSRFTLINNASGKHEELIFEFSLAFSQATIVPISYNAFGRTSPALTGIRYLNDNANATYGPGILQVRLSTNDDMWVVSCEQKVDDYLKPMEPVQFSSAVSGYNTTTPRTQVGLAFSDWSPLSMASGWEAYGGAFADTRYKMTPGGIIVVEGMVRNGTDRVIANLPEGARPEKTNLFNPHMRYNSVTGVGRVDVRATGEIVLDSPAASITQWVSLSGLTFQAHQ